MSIWEEAVSPEFRLWVHRILTVFRRAGEGGIALISVDGARVVCAQADLHWRDAPCGGCDKNETCPIPAPLEQGRIEGPNVNVVPLPDACGMPQAAVVGFADTTSTSSRADDSGLIEHLAELVGITWHNWHAREARLNAYASAMTTAQNLCKMVGRGASSDEIADRLTEDLADACKVNAWVALLKQSSPSPVVAPSSPAVPQETIASLLATLQDIDEIHLGDVFFLNAYPGLEALLKPLLAQTAPAGKDVFLGNIVAIPVFVESNGDPPVLRRCQVLFAALPDADHPPGPMLDRIRLFALPALLAWESVHEVAEATAVARQAALAVPTLDRLVGESTAMAELRLAILRAAKSDRTALLTGESGTGKELVAQLIHIHSLRGQFPRICELVAQELKVGRGIWESYHQPGMAPRDMVAMEYRSVPAVRAAELSDSDRNWKGDDDELAEIIDRAQRDAGLPRQFTHIYRSILRMLHEAWREDKLFNFFEFDSGAALTQNVSAELFGIVPEKFTDVKGGPGRFQVASHCGGTLFLDNIHHLDLNVQRALLKATEIEHEDRRVSRAGGVVAEPVHVRIIVATTDDLRGLVRKERFLGEWAARLMGEVIHIPPLRERREDIPLLASHFAALGGKRIAEDAFDPLAGPDWMGVNVRGLQNVVASAATRSDGDIIHRPDVVGAMTDYFGKAPDEPLTGEKLMILDALRRCRGNKSAAAKSIGWSRPKLYHLMAKHGISKDFDWRQP